MPDAKNITPILFCTDISLNRFDPADLFDLAFVLRSPEKFAVCAILLPDSIRSGLQALEALSVHTPGKLGDSFTGQVALTQWLHEQDQPINIIATANFTILAQVLQADRSLFREKVARLFLVGGHANDYTLSRAEGERLPIDPRLQERHPERFASEGDPRLADPDEQYAFGKLLTSGEGVIWLPRDICLWRYAAPQILTDGGPVCEFLLRELFWANIQKGQERFVAAGEPVLLSTLPAFLLATQPDPLGWLRLFRTVTARVETNTETGQVTAIAVKHERPNLYMVVGIDGRSLGEQMTKSLRIRPLIT